MTVGQNLSLACIGAFTRGLFTSRKREQELIDRSISDVHIKTDGGGAMIGSLSGGNQQKVVIGKMLATNPSVVLLDEPSRGIDIGAKAEVFKLLAEGAKRGLAVVYSTSEVGECLSVAHRIIVMRQGQDLRRVRPGRAPRRRSWRPRARSTSSTSSPTPTASTSARSSPTCTRTSCRSRRSASPGSKFLADEIDRGQPTADRHRLRPHAARPASTASPSRRPRISASSR